MVVRERSLAPFSAGLAEELAGLGYTPGCIARHVRLLLRLDEWMAGDGLTPAELTGDNVARFVRTRRATGQFRWPSQRGVAPLLGYLRRVGVVPTPAERVPAEPVERAYRRYLVEERALAMSTVEDYERYVRLFLSQLAEPVRADLTRLSAADVTGAVGSQCRSRSVGWAKNFNTALRSLLRFLFLDGHVPRDLSPSVLSVAGWRHRGLPTTLDPNDVARLLASCARQRRAGRRDLAILTLVVRLGFRAGEVAALELGDVDWRAGEIIVRGKAGRRDRLPLPDDVGEVIVDYLRHERPPTTARHVFILAVAPRTGISPKTVAGVVRCACERAGVAPIGPHRLRHTAATEMLRGGASLAEVGQVLRHEHHGDDLHLRQGRSRIAGDVGDAVATGVAMSRLSLLADEYLQTRRAFGYKLTSQARILSGFVRYLDEAGATRITVETALGFATQPAEAHPIWWTRRLSVVRGFATYVQAIDPTTEIPPTGLLAQRAPRAVPYLYTPAEIATLMAAARRPAPAAARLHLRDRDRPARRDRHARRRGDRPGLRRRRRRTRAAHHPRHQVRQGPARAAACEHHRGAPALCPLP